MIKQSKMKKNMVDMRKIFIIVISINYYYLNISILYFVRTSRRWYRNAFFAHSIDFDIENSLDKIKESKRW